MVLNEEQWIKELREKRIAYGISTRQAGNKLLVSQGISQQGESGKMKPSKELPETCKGTGRFNPEHRLPCCLIMLENSFSHALDNTAHHQRYIKTESINYMLQIEITDITVIRSIYSLGTSLSMRRLTREKVSF